MSMPEYPQYKESGVDWLGDIPRHWAMSRVKFDSVVKARVGWHGLKSDEFTDEGPYLVTGSDFNGKTIDWSNCYHCTEERYDQDQNIQLSDGDLLITKDGTIGKLMLVTDLPSRATLNSGIFVVRPIKSSYKAEFYYWMLQSSVFFDFIALRQTGSTISHLYQETFGNLPYGLPPLDEQTQIVRFLDHETAKIDALILEQERLIELLQEKRQAVISHAVTKGLDPDVPMKDSGVEWLGEVPAHWTIRKGSYIGRLFGSDPVPESMVLEEGRIPFLKVASLSASNIDVSSWDWFVSSEYQGALRPAKNFIVFPKRGAAIFLNKVNVVNRKAVIDPNLMGWEISEGHVTEFYAHVLKCRGLSELADVSTVPQINNKHVAPEMFPVPPVEEQRGIVRFLETRIQEMERLNESAKKSIELLMERRSALISAAVTGKIDVRNWQPPIDESAFDEDVHQAGMETTA